jgi:exodeoxyribonuclease V beta subunit
VTKPFDVCGPLPTGVTVLEASAGTGKTYTVAALAARFVAEGTPLEELLLVTFTRMATGELRDRVRERLVSALRGLAGGPRDRLVSLLAEGSPEEVAARRTRLARALADFDAATIATTHGFCQEVLAGLGVAGDVEREVEFVEDLTDLLNEVVDDLYVRRFFRGAEPPAITRAEAGRIAALAVANPVAPIEPVGAPADSVPAMRARLAEAVRRELELRKQRLGVITYDDLLTRLERALAGPAGEAVARGLRERFRVVLVDEFQDTDPVQWSIMRRAFGGGTLVLIGDPKQAIYAFRGADVYAYLDAAAAADTRATLDVNWRSDQGLIDAYDALFAGAQLGHPGIVYRRVEATEANRRPRLSSGWPLRLRVVDRDSVAVTPRAYAQLASVREHVAADLAGDLVGLLGSGVRVERRADDGSTIAREPVDPSHVAVLVQTNRAAARIRDALDAVDVPAVINGAGSVFGTAPARSWLRLLEALERPTSSVRARAAALTPFLGWSAERVAGAGEEEWEAVHRRLHDWARVLRLRGVASLAETITLAEGLPARVLAQVDGERALTDLRHVGELLHAEATASHLGPTALVGWLRRRIAEADQDVADEDRSRRLESDAEAVQVLTIHRSKGLEFPIIYYPDLWEPGYIPEGVPVAFHDPERGDERTIDVGLEGYEFPRHHRQHVVEQRGEDLRLAYVALTRAQHQAVVWWAPTFGSRDSSLGRLLFARGEGGVVPPSGESVPSDEAAWQRFGALSSAAPGCVSVERSRLGLPTVWGLPLGEPASLAAARFERELDRHWRRTSFSDITATTGEARVTSEPEEPVITDEPTVPLRATAAPSPDAVPAPSPDSTSVPLGAPAASRSALASSVPLGAMPSGVQVGTLVHRALEATDFTAPDLDAELAAHLDGFAEDDPAVIAGLRAAIETPLGELLDGPRLRDLGRADRLDELAFELPLAGGDVPRGLFALDGISEVLRALPPNDPLAGYADRLTDPTLRGGLRGYLTGTIDLVARAGDRFVVLDYKTNRLAAPEEDLTAWHYRPAALAAEMTRAHYGLQALLYLVALHRYLRWRLPDYDLDRHLGGVGYLFLRGMIGPATPVIDGTPCGVWTWRPPAAVVEAISDVLDRGTAS